MLPSKCPLCSKELKPDTSVKNIEGIECPNDRHYKYFYLSSASLFVEMFDVGSYRIANHFFITSGNIVCTVSDKNNYLAVNLRLNNVRLPPTITEKKLQTYITFS